MLIIKKKKQKRKKKSKLGDSFFSTGSGPPCLFSRGCDPLIAESLDSGLPFMGEGRGSRTDWGEGGSKAISSNFLDFYNL